MRWISLGRANPIGRRCVAGFATAALTLTLGAAGGLAQPTRPAAPPGLSADRELVVLNKAKRPVNELYVSPSNADQWGDDRLGDDTIDPGKSYRARLGRSRECEFDVQVVYDDASHEEMRNVNLCRTHQLAFDGTTAVAAPGETGPEHTLTLVNQSARPIQQVFISPADSTQWGDDRLGNDSISVGDRTEIQYRGECEADLRVIFDNKGAEERRSVNICDTPVVSIQPGWTTADTIPTAGPASKQLPPSQSEQAPAGPGPSDGARSTPGGPPLQQPATQAETAPAPEIKIVNHSGNPVAELYVYPEGRAERGQDWLGMATLNDGAEISHAFQANSGCKFHAHVVFSGKVPDEDIGGLDLCRSPEIVLAAP